MKIKKEDLITILKKSINRLDKGYSDELVEIEYMKELVRKIDEIIQNEEE